MTDAASEHQHGEGGDGGAAMEVTESGTRETDVRGGVAIGLIALAAVAVRVVFVVETREVPFVRHLIGDASGYFAWAVEIARGGWLGTEAFYQAPLYPYAMGVLFAALGESVWIVRLAQAVLGGAAVWCLGWAASRMLGRSVGIVSALMLALYAPAIFFDGVIQKASLGCALTCGLMAGMGLCVRRRTFIGPMLVGGLAGMLVLTRENAMVWLPVIGVWMWSVGFGRKLGPDKESVRSGRRGLGFLTVFVVGVVLVLLPVGLRNVVVGGEWSASTFQSGPNFYIGNHLGADGRYQPLVRGHESPAFEREDATRLAERDRGRSLSGREVSDYWWSRAWQDISGAPMKWFRLMGRKLLMVWNEYEVSDAESLYVYADSSVVLSVLGPVWHFGVLCPLAAVGFMLTWRRRLELWVYYALIVTMALSVVLFYVLARYRFPLVPLLIPFAAAGVVEIWREVRCGSVRRTIPALAVAVVVAGVVHWPIHDEGRLNAMAWMNAGVALAEDGDVVGATKYFRRAVAGHPESVEANNNLAMALAVQGDFAAAIRHYQLALASEPSLMGADYNLAVALERVGRLDEALRHYVRAVKIDPSDGDAQRALARLRKIK